MDESDELKDTSIWEAEDGLGFGREEHVLAGNDVEEIIFPDSLREIGRYIFYGCGNLRKLEFSDSLMQIGCGAFTGCHALQELVVHMKQGKKSGVKEMLGEMWQRIDVAFYYETDELKAANDLLAGNVLDIDSFTPGNKRRTGNKLQCIAKLVKLLNILYIIPSPGRQERNFPFLLDRVLRVIPSRAARMLMHPAYCPLTAFPLPILWLVSMP